MLRYLAFAAVALLTAMVWMLVLPAAPVVQPIAFNHAAHARTGCVTCHRGAESSARAGIPQGDLCVKCHATAPRAKGAAERWAGITRGDRIAWTRINRLPEHVMFSHRRHVALGRLDCASCHGDLKNQAAPVGVVARRLNMQTCLSCHRRENASEDCAACHR